MNRITAFLRSSYFFVVAGLLVSLAPSAHAATSTIDTSGISDALTKFTDLIDLIVPVIFAIAFIVFLWGVFQYFIAGKADEEKLKTGRSFVMWGIIGFVIMLSVWGLIHIITNTLGFGSDNVRPELPLFGSGKAGG